MRAPIENFVKLNNNIRVYPDVVYQQTDRAIVLGDLHANAMKLLYLLLLLDVIHLNQEAFRNLWTIYDKNTSELTEADLTQFEQLITESTITESRPGLLIFIGDEFADRGQNDFFTAIIFKHLHDTKIPYQIHLSNHGTYLINYLESGKQELTKLRTGQLASLDNLITLENKIPGMKEKFRELVEHAYKDHLCLIGYIQPVNAARPYLISHAPIDKITLENLTIQFSIEYNDASIDALISCIDKINLCARNLIKKNLFSSDILLGNENYVQCSKLPLAQLIEPYKRGFTDPMYETLWNRFGPRTPDLPCHCMNIHGHVGASHSLGQNFINHMNIDSNWGKPMEAGYDRDTGAILGFIPAADQEECLIFVSTVSPRDALSDYFKAYPIPMTAHMSHENETTSDTAPQSTTSSSRSHSFIDTLISKKESTSPLDKRSADSADLKSDEDEPPTKRSTSGK